MRKQQTIRSTIKNDPFAAVIPLPAEADLPEPFDGPVGTPKTPETPEPAVSAPPPVRKPRPPRAANADRTDAVPVTPRTGKQKLTVHVAADLAERVKNAAYWNPKLTIAGIAEQGIKHAIDRYEREHGGPYPPRDGELVGGRPIK